jgi:spermidine/putrescine transport system ATP-binding protein
MAGVAPNRRQSIWSQQLALFPMMSVGENVAFGLARPAWRAPSVFTKPGRRARRSGRRSYNVWTSCPAGSANESPSPQSCSRPTLLLPDEPLGALDLKLREH